MEDILGNRSLQSPICRTDGTGRLSEPRRPCGPGRRSSNPSEVVYSPCAYPPSVLPQCLATFTAALLLKNISILSCIFHCLYHHLQVSRRPVEDGINCGHRNISACYSLCRPLRHPSVPVHLGDPVRAYLHIYRACDLLCM